MKFANKMNQLEEYIFYELEKKKQSLEEKGVEIIDLSIGDPDMPTPDYIVDAMIDALKEKNCFNYPPYAGMKDLKAAIAQHYRLRYGVELNADSEVAVLIGSKEGISHLMFSLTDKDDVVIIPNPGYPVYKAAAIIANCICHEILLKQQNHYLPDLAKIQSDVKSKAKLMIVNYPNNPTGVAADNAFFDKLVDFGITNNIIVINDGAYMEITENPHSSASILQSKNAMDICVEFGSFSKTYNMTGWRLGYIAGNHLIIEQLMKVKANVDSGQFCAIQRAGIAALSKEAGITEQMNIVYGNRKMILYDALKKCSISFLKTDSTFYIWLKTPSGCSSRQFCDKLLDGTGIMAAPGCVFGSEGEGYCRLSVTAPTEKIIEAAKKLETWSIR